MATNHTTTTQRNKVKVIGAGFGRTGTNSFKLALEILGFSPCYHMKEVVIFGKANQWLNYSKDRNNLNELHALLGDSGYQATCDFPSAPYWKEQLQLYPEAKVILTVRDPESWYKSCSNTIFKVLLNGPNTPLGVRISLFIGITPAGRGLMTDNIVTKQVFHNDFSKENVIKCFEEHNLNVRNTCPKDKLLVFEVSQGWAPLCEFLDVPIPDVPFPRVNDTQQFNRLVTALNVFGYASVAIMCTGLVLLGKHAKNKWL